MALRTRFSWNCFNNNNIYFFICHRLQVIFIHYKSRIAKENSRLVVDEDDNGKFGLERVDHFKPYAADHDYCRF